MKRSGIIKVNNEDTVRPVKPCISNNGINAGILLMLDRIVIYKLITSTPSCAIGHTGIQKQLFNAKS